MPDEELVFLHLSDIHFHNRSGHVGDLDEDLRRQLLVDAESVREGLKALTGILVSGDVAYSGQQKEYETAKTWLNSMCDNLGCERDDAWTIPGNHDVDRNVAKNSLIVRNLHRSLRPADPTNVDREIGGLFDDPEAFDAIHRQVANYNRFAEAYGCAVGVGGKLHWEYDAVLNDTSILRLRGLNSALICNETDDDGANRLVVGTVQSQPPEEDGVAYLVMCHHPPDWIWERDELIDNLQARVVLSLFGHKHAQRIQPAGDTLRVVAGAVHPSRTEGNWSPRYNFLALSVQGQDDQRRLRVRIMPRVWNHKDRRFQAEFDARGSDTVVCQLPLKPWKPRAPSPTVGTGAGLPVAAAAVAVGDRGTSVGLEGRRMNPERRLTFRFFDLPYTRRMDVVQTLHLIQDDDEGVREDERYRRYFQRAKDKGLLAKFWEEVEKRHAEGEPEPNPFAGAR